MIRDREIFDFYEISTEHFEKIENFEKMKIFANFEKMKMLKKMFLFEKNEMFFLKKNENVLFFEYVFFKPF